ncbi:MAG: hypothetical protein VW683_04000 [Betaproteobacteria bacterium]
MTNTCSQWEVINVNPLTDQPTVWKSLNCVDETITIYKRSDNGKYYGETEYPKMMVSEYGDDSFDECKKRMEAFFSWSVKRN